MKLRVKYKGGRVACTVSLDPEMLEQAERLGVSRGFLIEKMWQQWKASVKALPDDAFNLRQHDSRSEARALFAEYACE